MTAADLTLTSPPIAAAFGAANRRRLINRYFSAYPEDEVSAATAWMHVYRLLLWTDRSNGLAHCYESDKSQPGKNWYSRSLAFHDWVSSALSVRPTELASAIDWLFRRAATELADAVSKSAGRISAAAERQRLPFAGKAFPEPGDDFEVAAVIKEVIGDFLSDDPPADTWRRLERRVRQIISLENKRKNLVGEGFEDVLAQIIRRTCNLAPDAVFTRALLHTMPGFHPPRRNEKPNKVDLAVTRPGMRTIVTAKWSLRADREKQFEAEFDSYSRAEAEGEFFEYVFVTNEFDPARLMRACEKVINNAHMFSHVVHINTSALRATYGDRPESSMRKVLGYIDSGRLISLEQWLSHLRPDATINVT